MSLAEHYRAYISVLNTTNLSSLSDFLDPHVIHNERILGVKGYRDLIPHGVVFEIRSMIIGTLEELPIPRTARDGRRLAKSVNHGERRVVQGGAVLAYLWITFDNVKMIETVRYLFDSQGRIQRVWSVTEEVNAFDLKSNSCECCGLALRAINPR